MKAVNEGLPGHALQLEKPLLSLRRDGSDWGCVGEKKGKGSRQRELKESFPAICLRSQEDSSLATATLPT